MQTINDVDDEVDGCAMLKNTRRKWNEKINNNLKWIKWMLNVECYNTEKKSEWKETKQKNIHKNARQWWLYIIRYDSRIIPNKMNKLKRSAYLQKKKKTQWITNDHQWTEEILIRDKKKNKRHITHMMFKWLKCGAYALQCAISLLSLWLLICCWGFFHFRSAFTLLYSCIHGLCWSDIIRIG